MSKNTVVGRYHVSFYWKAGGGHIITFEKTKDGVFFYDPQSGKKFTQEEIFNDWMKDKIEYNSLNYYRVDNLNVNLDLIKAVKKKPR